MMYFIVTELVLGPEPNTRTDSEFVKPEFPDVPPAGTSTVPRSLRKLLSTRSVMLSNPLILCRRLLLPSVFPRTGVFSNESALHIRSQYPTHTRKQKNPWGPSLRKEENTPRTKRLVLWETG